MIESLLSIITGFISAPPAILPRGVYSPIVYLYMDYSAKVLGDCYPAIKNWDPRATICADESCLIEEI